MLSQKLLSWYDINARVFPWRAKNPSKPNPYHVWLSEVMLQQTTTTTVVPYFLDFIRRWPDVQALADANLDDVLHGWQGLGYYSRARNLHKAAQILRSGFPETETALLQLPGVGPYTAAAIAAIAYDAKTAPVDGNIARVFARLKKLGDTKPKLLLATKSAFLEVAPTRRNGDFVQGLMDIGATICLPSQPRCAICPLISYCAAFRDGEQAMYPLKEPKRERETRHGVVFWIEDEQGRVLIRRRPETGLLGGMMEFPSTPWEKSELDFTPHQPCALKEHTIIGTTQHTFSHFHLRLQVMKGKADQNCSHGIWVKPEDLHHHALPTLMKKVSKMALSSR